MARSFSARAALRQSTYLSAAAPSGGWRGALPNPLGPRASPTAPAGSPRAGSSSGCPPGSGPSRARRSAMFASPTSPRPITLTISSTVVTSQCSAMRLRGTFCFFTGGTCRPYRRKSTRQEWGVRHDIDFLIFLRRSRGALARPRFGESFFLHRRTAELGLTGQPYCLMLRSYASDFFACFALSRFPSLHRSVLR